MNSAKQITAAIAVTAICVLPVAAFGSQTSSELLFQKTRQWSLPYKPVAMVQSADGSMLFFLTDNSRVLIYTSEGTLKGTIPVDKGVTSIDTDIRGENILLMNDENNTFTSISFDFIKDIDITGAPFKGADSAPVVVTVFTNFQ